jgi:hypothetical protein
MTAELAARIAETKALQASNIVAARTDRRYRRAFAQVALLRRSGWKIDVWDAVDGIHVGPHGAQSGPHLCVNFTAPGDCASVGSVGADGSLCGEPLDD